MKNKSPTYINWRETWSKMRRERIRPLRITYDKDFGTHFLADEFAKNQVNDYEYGKKAVKRLAGLLSSHSEVLEIGGGLGTLTIPLAEAVKTLKTIEISPKRTAILKKELKNKQIYNVEVIESDWMKYEIKRKFDLVVCSHFLWQIENLELHLEKMENASKKFCAIIQPSGRDAVVRKVYETIVSHPYQGQFEPDTDIFPYIILRHKGRLLSNNIIEYAIKRSQPQLVRYVASFIGKYTEVDKKIGNIIADFVKKYLQNNFHIEYCKAVVMWWRVN